MSGLLSQLLGLVYVLLAGVFKVFCVPRGRREVKYQRTAGKNPSLEVPLFLAIKRGMEESRREKEGCASNWAACSSVVCGGRTCIKTLAKNAQ